jgi:hypothetical protein
MSQCKFQLHAGQCRSVTDGGFGLSLSVLSNIVAAVAPADAVEGSKMLQLIAFPDATFCAAVGGCAGWSLSIFQHQRLPLMLKNKT